MTYRGVTYIGFRQLMSSLSPPSPVKEVTVTGRLRRFFNGGGKITDEILDEIFYLDAKQYQSKYGKRVTWVETPDGPRSVDTLYTEYASRDGVIPYHVFRTRLKSMEKRSVPVTSTLIDTAASYSQADWITEHGGGRRKRFVYNGDHYPDRRGEYTAFTSFLKAIDRYDEREMMHARLKAKWAIDDMLSEPPMSDGAPGYIYKITDTTTGKVYVGLTVNKPDVRWNQHVQTAARGGGSLLHDAIRLKGAENFMVDVLEVVESGEHKLAERESSGCLI